MAVASSGRVDAAGSECGNQLGRRNLTDAQRVQLALRLKPVAQAKAKERQKEGASAKVPQIFGEAKEAMEQVAEAAGVSAETVRKVEKVNAKAVPELRAAMNANAVTINTAEVARCNFLAGPRDFPRTVLVKVDTPEHDPRRCGLKTRSREPLRCAPKSK